MSHNAKLAFFVTSTACFGAVQTPTECIVDMCLLGSQSQSAVLVPFLQNLLQKAGNPTLGTLIAPKGPGSFTSLRVTLATAQGLSIALPHATCYAPTMFDVLLHTMSDQSFAVIDSKRGDYFVQIKDAFSKPHEPQILTAEAFVVFQDAHSDWQMIVEPDLMDADLPLFAHKVHYDSITLLTTLLDADIYVSAGTFEPYYLFDPVFKKSTKALF